MGAQMIGEIGLIQRAPFMNPPLEQSEIDTAHPPARRFHDVEHGNMGVHLHVTRRAALRAGQRVQLRHRLALLVLPHDLNRRPGRVMVERHPADGTGLITPFSRVPDRGPADLPLNGGHDIVDGIPVRLVQHRLLGFGGRKRPGDGERFGRGEGQIDIANPHLGGLKNGPVLAGTHLPAIGITPRQNMRRAVRGSAFYL